MSHPVWVCGLKHTTIFFKITILWSHPVWVCGLKLCCKGMQAWFRDVTPCMGVWIETVDTSSGQVDASVTPCMGVWIET